MATFLLKFSKMCVYPVIPQWLLREREGGCSDTCVVEAVVVAIAIVANGTKEECSGCVRSLALAGRFGISPFVVGGSLA